MPGGRSGYPATPLLARLTPANGWHHDLVGDDHPYALVVVRVGPLWTDSGAIGEDQILAMRHRTNDNRLIQLPSE